MTRRLPLLCALASVAAALGGCSGDGNLVRDVAMRAGITGGEPKPAPDFVTRTRPESVDYTPIGAAPPPRSTRPKSQAAVSGAEAEMNQLRTANEARAASARRAGASPPPAPVKPPE